jgi:sterol desaturase/sphingolipid hydroxylase (fatty acid hydroxylase superfamily)
MTIESIIRLVLFLGGLICFLIFELLGPYRPSSVSKPVRWINNLGLAILNSFLLYLFFYKPTYRTSIYVINNSAGLLNLTDLPYWIKVLIAVMFLDFEIYVWHFLNHEMPLLWRFHRVHHSDLNLDVSTASRFHIIELGISAIIKIALIFFLGIDLLMIAIFESAVVLTSQFHHSSLKLPKWFEEIWWTLFVPPSMHRIHHSVIIRERNSNYGVIFSIWDRILGTLIRKADQSKILIGMGAYRRVEKLNLYHLMKMPFTRSVR